MCRAWGLGQGFTRCQLALLAAGSARTCVSEIPDPRRELRLIDWTTACAGFLCLDRWVSYVLTTNTFERAYCKGFPMSPSHRRRGVSVLVSKTVRGAVAIQTPFFDVNFIGRRRCREPRILIGKSHPRAQLTFPLFGAVIVPKIGVVVPRVGITCEICLLRR